MPNREHNPPPEDLKSEVCALLASCVQRRILINVLVIDVLHGHDYEERVAYLFNRECKETLPTRPHSIVHRREPVRKENLTAEPIRQRKCQLSKHKHDILPEVV